MNLPEAVATRYAGVVKLQKARQALATPDGLYTTNLTREIVMPAKGTIPRVCAVCTAPFMARPEQVSRGTGRFCTIACALRGRPKRAVRLVSSCAHCGLPMAVRPWIARRGGDKFCSQSCYFQDLATRSPLVERFWAKVDRSGPGPEHRPELGPCWQWTASRTRAGYGKFSIRRGCFEESHRVSWRLHSGPIPDGLWVLHHCDNPPCVRPSHLFLGTNADNVADMLAKGRGWHQSIKRRTP